MIWIKGVEALFGVTSLPGVEYIWWGGRICALVEKMVALVYAGLER